MRCFICQLRRRDARGRPRGRTARALLVNALGGMPALELYLMVNSALRVLRGKGLNVSRFLIGNYVTSLEMPVARSRFACWGFEPTSLRQTRRVQAAAT